MIQLAPTCKQWCNVVLQRYQCQSSVRRQKGLTGYCFKYIGRPFCLQTDAVSLSGPSKVCRLSKSPHIKKSVHVVILFAQRTCAYLKMYKYYLTLTLPGPSAGVSGSLDSYCSLKPLCSGMGEVVPARTSPTLLPPSPRTVLSLSCFKVSQCINCHD